jgi:hypothetical protein
MFNKKEKMVEAKVEPKVEPVVEKPVVKTEKAKPVAKNPSEVVVDGKLYKSVAYQPNPHDPVQYKLEEVKE